MKRTIGDRLSQGVVTLFVVLAIIVCLLPIVNVVAVSFSSNSAILASKVGLWPVEPTLQSYEGILSDKSMVWSLAYTVLVTLLATLASMLLSVALAYALTKKRLKGRVFFLILIVITMYFSGGLIPDYLLVKDLGMLDTVWSLVLPGAVSAYNMIILKTFFQGIPESYEESAVMDGAHDLQVLTRIVLPLSAPVLATISLFYAVGRWNGFFDALFYINTPDLYPLQLKLYQIIVNSTSLDVTAMEGQASSAMLPESIKAACIVFATVPILLVYPWLQRYFIKGTTIGGIKG